MAASSNHWKLGLFVVAGLATALAAVALLGAHSMHHDVGLYVSYFDESVQGLEVGSPIKFRGVTIGTVGQIHVAPDHRHVEVESKLALEELTRLGLDIAKEPTQFGAIRKLEMTADLRLQLASAGLTGVKFLQLDFFDITAYPPPVMPFPVPANYIPTAPSMTKSLEDSLPHMISRLTQISDQTASILGAVDVMFRDIRKQNIPAQIATTLHTVSGLITRVDRDKGLLSSVERASNAIGDTLRDADGLGGQLVETLVSVQRSARSIDKFIGALEQDPDMLLKGRRREKK